MVTGAADFEVRVHNIVRRETTRLCICHASRVKRLATAPDSPDLFWSAAEDGIIRYCYFHKIPYSLLLFICTFLIFLLLNIGQRYSNDGWVGESKWDLIMSSFTCLILMSYIKHKKHDLHN